LVQREDNNYENHGTISNSEYDNSVTEFAELNTKPVSAQLLSSRKFEKHNQVVNFIKKQGYKLLDCPDKSVSSNSLKKQ
jgi:hypothetical protein